MTEIEAEKYLPRGFVFSKKWAEEHIIKDVCRLSSKLASATNTQIESS